MYKILTSAPQYLALLLLYFLESNYLSLQPRVVFFFIFTTSAPNNVRYSKEL